MNRRESLFVLIALLASRPSRAQKTERIYRVGWIVATAPTTALAERSFPNARLFLDELRVLGYVEGRNLILDVVSAEGHADRYPELIAQILRRKPDVIVVGGSQLCVAAKKATSTIPIVMSGTAQPVEYGLIASLARPGGNVTGLAADVSPDIEGKRLQLLKQIVPKLSRISCLATKWIWEGPIGQAVRVAGKSLGIEVMYAEHIPADLKTTFANVARQRSDALFVPLSPDVYRQRQEIAEFAFNARIPSTYPFAEFAETGGLMSYGWDIPEGWRITARYVDKILKGAKPGDLPVQQPTKFELVINLKTAKALGLTIPQELLFRADRVIE